MHIRVNLSAALSCKVSFAVVVEGDRSGEDQSHSRVLVVQMKKNEEADGAFWKDGSDASAPRLTQRWCAAEKKVHSMQWRA